jgi:hypothetical protein
MRAYLEQHNGRFILGKECDVCWVDSKLHDYGLREFLMRSDIEEYSYQTPNLCPDHGRELGVAW